jgi:hypothetical protein
MELVKGTFFEVSGINCSIENPSFVTAVISVAQFRFSRPWLKERCQKCQMRSCVTFVCHHGDQKLVKFISTLPTI